MHVPIINCRNMFSDPIWSHLVYIIWQLGRNPPLLSNAVAMAFVETIQTLQLICEAWWELRTLKMQNRKDNSWRRSLSLSPCFVLCSFFVLHPLFPFFFFCSFWLHWHFLTRALYINFAFPSFWGCWGTGRELGAEAGQISNTNEVKVDHAILMRWLNGVPHYLNWRNVGGLAAPFDSALLHTKCMTILAQILSHLAE